jgi:uncharacterized repeat protein (TIGR03803 family)
MMKAIYFSPTALIEARKPEPTPAQSYATYQSVDSSTPMSPALPWMPIALMVFFLLALRTAGVDVVFQSMRTFGSLGAGDPLLRAGSGDLYGTTVTGGDNASGTIFRITTNGLLSTVYSFSGGEDGNYPSGLIQAEDGNFYGTTREELGSKAGTVFRMTPDGVLTTLYSFTGLADGSDPNGVVQGSDGNLYGTTIGDGASGSGTIFRISTNGILNVLYSFSGQGDGGQPTSGLLPAVDGNLYGTTSVGGTMNFGTVFRITTNGALTTLHRFNGTNDGANPWAVLVQAGDGVLYGTTTKGGGGTSTNDYGTVFRITTEGVFTRLHAFTGGNGAQNPYGRLAQAGNGVFYGTTQAGGAGGYGAVFRISTNGAFTLYHSFNWTDGSGPFGGLVLADDGKLYGATVRGGAFGSGTVFRITPTGGFTLVQSLPAAYTGMTPASGLAAAADGWLYGTTPQGGASNRGTIFGIATDGAFTPLHSFAGGAADGESPGGELLRASDGNLYGATQSGGTSDAGTVFRITPEGVFTLLHSFNGGNEGAHLWSGLVQGRDGRLYGTTGDGGSKGNGTAFRVTLDGVLTTFYSFTTSVGGGPRARLSQGSDGAFYGTSSSGGTHGQGTVYRLTTNGVLTLLHSFSSDTNGYYPTTPLVQASDGVLYGTTDFGGAGGHGTVFRITTNGTFTTVHSFNGFDGDRPSAGLMQASDGNIYGTTYGNPFLSNPSNNGSVFRIDANGVFTTLYTFTGGGDGAQPSGLAQADDGNLYGTTYAGGILSAGTVFRILIAPPVIQPSLAQGGNFVFNFRTVVRKRYTVEQKPNVSTANWSVYTTLDGDGSLFRVIVPTDYYPEQYFRIRKP